AHDQEVCASLEQAQKHLDELDPRRQNTIDTEEGVSRRKAMALLISTPSALFGMAQAHGSHSAVLHPQETLSLSTVSIPLCWQLYFEGGFSELEQLLPGYLAQLSALGLQSSPYQKKAARLAAQAQQLACLLALQRQDFGTALKHARDALKHGQTAEDANLQLAATVRYAYIYFCLKQHEQCFHMYSQQGLAYQEDCSPLLRGFLYASLAETYAGRGEQDPALEYLRRAYDIFPQRPEDDSNFSYTHFRRLTLDNLEGQVYLHLKQPRQAWEAFLRVDRAAPPIPYKLAVTIHKAATMLALNEMEPACSLLECAATTALAFGSSLRYSEAYTVYRQIQDTWRHERPVKALQELFYRNLFL
ncbi:MAG TPA: tetratricopeptide repeat protein, partial [Ktedonobacteraceae bacterium]|nr:tetratricopeptide repeat protein [Ktedonobacteraceae bacterium]